MIMGWTFFDDRNPRESRADIIEREFTQQPSEGNPWAYGFEYIATRGNTVYAVMWRENPSEGVPRYYFGAIFLTRRNRGEFGYKDMSEDMGPHVCDAPLKMINLLDQLAPEPKGYAAKWRESVRAHHAKKKARPKWCPGMHVTLRTGWTYQLIEPAAPRKGWRVKRNDGTIWRMPFSQLARADLVTL
jgi:hypothetical protein